MTPSMDETKGPFKVEPGPLTFRIVDSDGNALGSALDHSTAQLFADSWEMRWMLRQAILLACAEWCDAPESHGELCKQTRKLLAKYEARP